MALGPAVGDVLGDREREQERLLEDDARPARAGCAGATSRRSWPSIVTRPEPGVEEARARGSRACSCPRPVAPDERHGLARARLEPDAPQHRAGRARSRRRRPRTRTWPRTGGSGRRARPLHDLGRRVEDLGDTIEPATGRLEPDVDAGQGRELRVEGREVGDEHEQGPGRHRAVEDRLRTEQEDDGRPDRRDESSAERREAADHAAALVRPDRGTGHRAESAVLALLLAERAHDRQAGERLLDVSVSPALDLALRSCDHPRGPAERRRRDDHERRKDEGDQREADVHRGHDHDHQRDRQERVSGSDDERIHDRVRRPAIAGDTTDADHRRRAGRGTRSIAAGAPRTHRARRRRPSAGRPGSTRSSRWPRTRRSRRRTGGSRSSRKATRNSGSAPPGRLASRLPNGSEGGCPPIAWSTTTFSGNGTRIAANDHATVTMTMSDHPRLYRPA